MIEKVEFKRFDNHVAFSLLFLMAKLKKKKTALKWVTCSKHNRKLQLFIANDSKVKTKKNMTNEANAPSSSTGNLSTVKYPFHLGITTLKLTLI